MSLILYFRLYPKRNKPEHLLPYELKPLELADGTFSEKVFFLCANGQRTPFEQFTHDCTDKIALKKMATAITAVDTVGVQESIKAKRLTRVRGGKSDLYEVRTHGCTARAYSFVLEGHTAIAICFIEQVTHTGEGVKNVQNARERLEKKRPALNEAIENRKNQ